jgi:hypothetical protein
MQWTKVLVRAKSRHCSSARIALVQLTARVDRGGGGVDITNDNGGGFLAVFYPFGVSKPVKFDTFRCVGQA